jgi:hypothetical protein
VIQSLLTQGRIDPGQIKPRPTHERVFGGDGRQHWLPLAKKTFNDGQAAFWAHEAAKIPTPSVPKGGEPDFKRGWHEASRDRQAGAVMAAASTVRGSPV